MVLLLSERVAALPVQVVHGAQPAAGPSLTSVGVPVRDSTGTIIAALNISGPTVRTADRIDALAATAEMAARRLSRLLTGGGQ